MVWIFSPRYSTIKKFKNEGLTGHNTNQNCNSLVESRLATQIREAKRHFKMMMHRARKAARTKGIEKVVKEHDDKSNAKPRVSLTGFPKFFNVLVLLVFTLGTRSRRGCAARRAFFFLILIISSNGQYHFD
jgi:hypothetical protein